VLLVPFPANWSWGGNYGFTLRNNDLQVGLCEACQLTAKPQSLSFRYININGTLQPSLTNYEQVEKGNL